MVDVLRHMASTQDIDKETLYDMLRYFTINNAYHLNYTL
jgi:hypothetical protein